MFRIELNYFNVITVIWWTIQIVLIFKYKEHPPHSRSNCEVVLTHDLLGTWRVIALNVKYAFVA